MELGNAPHWYTTLLWENVQDEPFSVSGKNLWQKASFHLGMQPLSPPGEGYFYCERMSRMNPIPHHARDN